MNEQYCRISHVTCQPGSQAGFANSNAVSVCSFGRAGSEWGQREFQMQDSEHSNERVQSRITKAMLKPGHIRALHVAQSSEFFLSELAPLTRFGDRRSNCLGGGLHV